MVDLIVVKNEDEGSRLDRWLARYYPNVPFGAIQKEIRTKGIRINNKRVENKQLLNAGDTVRIPFSKEEKFSDKPLDLKAIQAKFKIETLFENEDLIVINKPAGISVQGGTNIKISIDTIFPDYKLVHRLDKDTSGVLIMAKNVKASAKLMEYFKEKQILKTYLAVVVGIPLKNKGVIKTKMELKSGSGGEKMYVSEDAGQDAETAYLVLDKFEDKLALVQAQPSSGRKHQIRVHMNYLGCPILGDGKYGGKKAFLDDNKTKIHLHALKCKILPENIEIKAEIPYHIKNTLAFYQLVYKD